MDADPFEISKVSGNLVFEFLDSELNLFNIDDISRKYHGTLRSCDDAYDSIVIDMSNVHLVDSTTVSFLVRAHLLAKKAGKNFFLRNVGKTIKQTLEYANLQNDFDVICN